MIQIREMVGRIFAGLFLLAFIGLSGLLVYSALKPDRLPLGASMPNLDFVTSGGHGELRPDSTKMTLIIYFHSTCEYCRLQLEEINQNSAALQTERVFLLTPEQDFFAASKMASWPRITEASNMTWAIVQQGEILERLDVRATPTTYIFDKSGKLVSKISGATRLASVLMELQKNGGSGTPSMRP